MKIFNLVLVAVSLCLAAPACGDSLPVDKRPAIIFLPGLYGSFLRDVTTKKRIFITADEAMGGTDTLSLYQKELQTPAGPTLEKDGVLDTVVVIPGIYEIDVYGQMLTALRAIPGHQVIPFDYDWRKDISLALANLDQLVKKLHAQGVKQIDLVGHSGGAYIALYYAGYGTQTPESATLNWSGATQIRRLALMGGPFKGGFIIFHDMNRGADLPMIGHMLPSETNASFPFLYEFMPFSNLHALDQNGQSVPFPLDDVAFWQQNSFGLFDQKDLPADILKNRADFEKEQIAHGKAIADRMQFSDNVTPPSSLKILNVVGKGTPTTETAYYLQGDHGMQVYFDSDDLNSVQLQVAPLQVDGDGMVTIGSATIPKILKANTRTINSLRPHAQIVEDTDVQDAIAHLITGA